MIRNFSLLIASKQKVSALLVAKSLIARWLRIVPWKQVGFASGAGRPTKLGQLTASTAMLLIAFLAGLAASPQLHEILHRDAGHADHDCIVTAFHVGEALFVAPEFPVAPTWLFLFGGASHRSDGIQVRSVNLRPPSCGPPAGA